MNRVTSKYSVLGAGNGGQALAAYLSLNGCDITLYDIDSDLIDMLKDNGGIQLTGVKGEGFANTIHFTKSISEAAEFSDVLLICTPAFAHIDLAEKLAPYLKNGQMILLCPGSTGGAFEFKSTLKRVGSLAEIIVAETASFFYACRASDGTALISGVKTSMGVAALPGSDTGALLDRIGEDFPELYPEPSVLQIDINNINPIVHVLPIIMNLSWVENPNHNFLFYMDGITPTVAKWIEKLDDERVLIAEELGLEALSVRGSLSKYYGVESASLYDMIQNTKAYGTIQAPKTLYSRLIIEDVPMGLVPMVEIAKLIGVATPELEFVIDLVDKVLERDFKKTGRTLETMGLEGLTLEQIRAML